MDSSSPSTVTFLREDERFLQSLCARFEEAWQSGARPELKPFLLDAEQRIHSELLRRLVHIDWENRLRVGEEPSSSDYVTQFPEQAALLQRELKDKDQDPRSVASSVASGSEPLSRMAQQAGEEEVREEANSSSAGSSSPGPGTSEGANTSLQATTADASPQPPPGELPSIQGYELLEVLGKGGMGIVYKAIQLNLNRVVALKLIQLPSFKGEEAVARFRTEAEAVAGVRHPHIVQIYDVQEEGEIACLSLEYIEGGSLARKLRGAPIPGEEAAGLVAILAEAVHVVHEHGVIHRDLKPGNILLTLEGSPKVSDFGLAKRLDEESGITASGDVLGTPSYMAPEQAAGEVHRFTGLVDVYALGAILYECLTGRPPFRGASTFETLHQVRTKEPIPPRQFQPEISNDLEVICLKCLEKEPLERYESAEALAEDLRRLLAEEPILARPPSRAARMVKWLKRHPGTAVSLATSLVAGLIVLGIFIVSYFEITRANAETAGANQQLKQTIGELKTANDKYREEVDSHKRTSYERSCGLAFEKWEQNQIEHARKILKDTPSDLRGFEWHYLNRLCHSSGKTIQAHSHPIVSLALSPNGKWLATGDKKGVTKLWDVQTGMLRHEWNQGQGAITSVQFDPKSGSLASAMSWFGKTVISIYESSSGKLVSHCKGHRDVITSLAFSPDGKALVSGSRDRTFRIWDPKTGKPLGQYKDDNGMPIDSVCFHPSGKSLVVTSSRSRLTVLETENYKVIRAIDRGGRMAAFSGNGKYLYARLDSGIIQHDTSTWIRRTVLLPNVGFMNQFRVEPRLKLMLTLHSNSALLLWDPHTGSLYHAVRMGKTGDAQLAVLSNDTSQVITAHKDGTLRFWPGYYGQHDCLNPSTPLRSLSQRFVYYCGGSPHQIRQWDLHKGGYSWKSPMLPGHNIGAVPSEDERVLLALSSGFLPKTGKRFSRLHFWDIEEKKSRWSRDFEILSGSALSRNGKHWAAVSQYTTLLVGETETGKTVLTLSRERKHFPLLYLFHPKQPYLVVADKSTLVLLDLVTKAERWLKATDAASISALAFSPDGSLLVTGKSDGTVVIRGTMSGEVSQRMTGHGHPIRALLVSKDNSRVISASGAKISHSKSKVKLWNRETGQEILTLCELITPITALAFDQKEERLLATSYYRALVWDSAPPDRVLKPMPRFSPQSTGPIRVD